MPDTSSAADVDRSPHQPTPPPRWMWVLLMLLASTIVGGVAGLLTHASGATVPQAILAGGGSFAGAFVLMLAIAHYTGGGRS